MLSCACTAMALRLKTADKLVSLIKWRRVVIDSLHVVMGIEAAKAIKPPKILAQLAKIN